MFQVLLHRLEESVLEEDQGTPEENGGVNSLNMEEASSERQPQTGLDEAEIREFLSAKNLKSLRNDSTKKSSGCFGRRMDRIGSMSSLGCNTIGRYSKFHRGNATASWRPKNGIFIPSDSVFFFSPDPK